jgi:hypothetical protein
MIPPDDLPDGFYWVRFRGVRVVVAERWTWRGRDWHLVRGGEVRIFAPVPDRIVWAVPGLEKPQHGSEGIEVLSERLEPPEGSSP